MAANTRSCSHMNFDVTPLPICDKEMHCQVCNSFFPVEMGFSDVLSDILYCTPPFLNIREFFKLKAPDTDTQFLILVFCSQTVHFMRV